MIRVLLRAKPEYNRYLELFDRSLYDVYATNGVEFVDSGPCDLMLIADTDVYNIPNDKRVILLEKYASAAVRSETHVILELRKNVVAVFKNTLIPSAPVGRQHYKHINGDECSNAINARDVYQVLWNFHYSPFNKNFISELLPNHTISKRGLHACFRLSKDKTIYKHRSLALIAAYDIHEAVVGERPKNEYDKELLASKVVLSPWGFGEYCMRDYEAIYAGCAVVKPLPYGFLDTTGLYNNNPCLIPCKTDFSDLTEVYERTISNWDKISVEVTKMRSMLLSNNDIRIWAKRLALELLKWS